MVLNHLSYLPVLFILPCSFSPEDLLGLLLRLCNYTPILSKDIKHVPKSLWSQFKEQDNGEAGFRKLHLQQGAKKLEPYKASKPMAASIKSLGVLPEVSIVRQAGAEACGIIYIFNKQKWVWVKA